MSDELERLREELDSANRKLAEAHKMASLGRLSAGIVHEINTPIGSIFSNTEVITRSLDKVKSLLEEAIAGGTAPPRKAVDLLGIVSNLNDVDKLACERISGVVRSLKTLARVSSHELRKTDVNELICHTLKLAKTVFRQRIEFLQETVGVLEAECYPGLLGQVLLNLVVNAAQAIDGEGQVTVRTSEQGELICIDVADTGKGIRPEDRSKIFQAGFSTKPIGEGTGIGLALSREIIVDTHSGTIDFESVPGAGTTFHVRIPLTQRKGD